MQSVGISNKRNIVSLSVMVNFSPFAQYKASVVLLLPIEEVLEEIDEGWLIQDTLLGEQMEVEGVRKRLHKLQFEFKPRAVGRSCVVGRQF